MTWRSDLSDQPRGAAGLGTPPSSESLGDDWVPGPDGVRERSAARVILMDVVDHLVAGWDGEVRHLGEQFDD